jgi:kanamycin kinase
MKRTLLNTLPDGIPNEVMKILDGGRIYDSSCSPEARVYFVDKDGGYYLKRGKSGTLLREGQMAEYFAKKGLSPRVLGYYTNEYDWLLTERAPGEDSTHAEYLADPERLARVLGERLRALHELSFADCPVQNRLSEYLARADENYRTGNYDKDSFPDSFGYASADEAMAVIKKYGSALRNDTLIHGDYCLPNVMLDNWKFSAFIDVGNGGVGDRHIDLFWGVWTLWYNLKTNEYEDRFLDAYGRQNFDRDMLRVVAAFEVFG